MSAPTDQYVRHATLVRVIDGDTLVVDFDLGFSHRFTEHVRLTRVDTPEPRGHEAAAGQYVTQQVRSRLLPGCELSIHSVKFQMDSFDRCLAEVWLGDVCLNEWLIDEGLAWQTDDRGKLIESRLVDNLSGVPDGIKQQVREELA